MKLPRLYLFTTVALLLLLAGTIAVSFVDCGPFNTAIAMLFSVAKATLILMYFMDLRRASPLLRLFAGAGFFWLAIMISLVLSDYLTRH